MILQLTAQSRFCAKVKHRDQEQTHLARQITIGSDGQGAFWSISLTELEPVIQIELTWDEDEVSRARKQKYRAKNCKAKTEGDEQ